jgi:hypothetical protein
MQTLKCKNLPIWPLFGSLKFFENLIYTTGLVQNLFTFMGPELLLTSDGSFICLNILQGGPYNFSVIATRKKTSLLLPCLEFAFLLGVETRRVAWNYYN